MSIVKHADLSQQDNVPQFKLGSEFHDGENKYRYVRAVAAKTIGLLYGIDETFTVSATGVVTTEVHPLMGVPAFTTLAKATGFDYKHFWIQTAGNFPKVVAHATVVDNANVYASATAGEVDDGDASGVRIRGLKFTTATSGAGDTTAFSANELNLATA